MALKLERDFQNTLDLKHDTTLVSPLDRNLQISLTLRLESSLLYLSNRGILTLDILGSTLSYIRHSNARILFTMSRTYQWRTLDGVRREESW